MIITSCSRLAMQGGKQATQPPVAAVVRTSQAQQQVPLGSGAAHKQQANRDAEFAFDVARPAGRPVEGQQYVMGGAGNSPSTMASARERMASHAAGRGSG